MQLHFNKVQQPIKPIMNAKFSGISEREREREREREERTEVPNEALKFQ